MSKKVIVAMSGGVDSTVTAALLKEQGYDVVGVTMNLWDGRHSRGEITPPVDVVNAGAQAAEQLDISFHSYDLVSQFRRQVVDHFCDEYLNGRTPNPCIICNQYLKFGQLLNLSAQLGGDFLATGHYVRVAEHQWGCQIRKGADLHKDQSYFLFTLGSEQVRRCLFPLGALTKTEVREHARRLQLNVAQRTESQDICFVPDGDYARFLDLEREASSLGGDIVHVSGQVLGRHQGMHRYTVGQRKGLGIGWSEPLYVVRIDGQKQQVVVGEREHLNRTQMALANCYWNPAPETNQFRCQCRIRYRHQEAPAQIEILPNGRAGVTFDDPQFGVTPGQAAVFYADDCVIGGGWIE